MQHTVRDRSLSENKTIVVSIQLAISYSQTKEAYS